MPDPDQTPPRVVRGGTFCSDPGAKATTSTGRTAECSLNPAKPTDRYRWRATEPPKQKPTTGRRRRTETAQALIAAEPLNLITTPLEMPATTGIPAVPAASITDQVREMSPEEAEAGYQRAINLPARDISAADLAAAVQHLPNVPAGPGEARRREQLVTEAARRMYPPDPDVQPVSGAHSDKPIAGNTWGTWAPQEGNNHFHDDGVLGQTIRQMGTDGRIDVDGEPVANHVGRIATDVDLCTITPQQGLERIAALRNRMPAGSQAHRALDFAVSEMGCPDLPVPSMPAGTPEPVRRLVEDLHHNYPMIRRDHMEILGGDDYGQHRDGLIDVVNGLERGARDYCGTSRFIEKVREVAFNRRHESNGDRGKRAIDLRVQECIEELQALAKENRTVFYPPDQRR